MIRGRVIDIKVHFDSTITQDIVLRTEWGQVLLEGVRLKKKYLGKYRNSFAVGEEISVKRKHFKK